MSDSIATTSLYHYVPSRDVAIVFIVLFGFSTVLHIGQAIWARIWWLFPTIIIAGAAEMVGWGGRLWGSYEPLNRNSYILQSCVTVVAPTPMVAANFIILGRIIEKLGMEYSRLKPRLYSTIFVTCDIIALMVQGSGGGLAASSDDPTTGVHIMLAGIIFQIAAIVAYSLLAIEFFARYTYDKPFRPAREYSKVKLGEVPVSKAPMGMRLKIMSCALAFSTLVLVIRSIYRTIEFLDGYDGRIISTEVYFNVLDGAMIILAIYVMNFVHPGIFLTTRH